MSMTRRALSLAAAGLMLGLAAGQAMADQLQDILDRGTIRVGVIADVAPFGFVDAEQKPTGLDVDIANLIATDLGVEAEIVQMTAQNRIPYLVTDKVDILVAILSLTPERAKQIMFTAPYASTTIGLFGPPDIAVTGAADLAGKSIGVSRGTVEDAALTALAPDADIIRFEDNATATTAYQSGQVDLYATADILAYELNKGDGRKLEIKIPFGADLAHMGVRAGEFGMLQWLNSFIYVHKGNGDLNELTLKWLNVPVADLPPL
jgi:polar amino acid transport system substrate-binding protein